MDLEQDNDGIGDNVSIFIDNSEIFHIIYHNATCVKTFCSLNISIMILDTQSL